jgi:hypothetical protein
VGSQRPDDATVRDTDGKAGARDDPRVRRPVRILELPTLSGKKE